MSVVHEMAHAVTGGSITDRAYRTNRYYRWMTPGEAITNAESYGLLAQELGTGTQVADSAPRDTIEDCPDDWDLALARSTAIAERWNRNAQTALADRRPSWLSQWTDLQTRYLGGTSTATLDSAKRIYDATLNAFRDNIAFECEPGATGGRCASSQTYWYGAFSDFHICPSWRALPTEARRTQALLQGFFGYKDVEGDDTRRANLAALARELSERYWPSVPLERPLVGAERPRRERRGEHDQREEQAEPARHQAPVDLLHRRRPPGLDRPVDRVERRHRADPVRRQLLLHQRGRQERQRQQHAA